jgi:hypothetical protein
MRTAFDDLERWTAPRGGQAPPRSTTVPRQTTGDVVNTCSIG